MNEFHFIIVVYALKYTLSRIALGFMTNCYVFHILGFNLTLYFSHQFTLSIPNKTIQIIFIQGKMLVSKKKTWLWFTFINFHSTLWTLQFSLSNYDVFMVILHDHNLLTHFTMYICEYVVTIVICVGCFVICPSFFSSHLLLLLLVEPLGECGRESHKC